MATEDKPLDSPFDKWWRSLTQEDRNKYWPILETVVKVWASGYAAAKAESPDRKD